MFYLGYRQADYSKKFKQEHEADILLHQTAKKCFDELGLTRLPTLKTLKQEYSELLSSKKAAYSRYRKLQSEAKDITTVKVNVDQLLKMDMPSAREDIGKHRQHYVNQRFCKSRSRSMRFLEHFRVRRGLGQLPQQAKELFPPCGGEE